MGAAAPLPIIRERQDEIARYKDASGEFVLPYRHFSCVQNGKYRMPFYSACNINGILTQRCVRSDTWLFDGRIELSAQMLHEAYGSQREGKFSRGHMTRRQDPVWGSPNVAQQANLDTFVATNACPQWQVFNNGIWGELEDYILNNADGDDKKVSVFTGPFFDRTTEKFSIQVPHDFWKVVAFISENTHQLSAIAYVMSQSEYLQVGLEADLSDFLLSQVSVASVAARAGIDFGVLNSVDVFAGAGAELVSPIRFVADTRLPSATI